MTKPITIWHNPRCSKSRQTLTLLETQNISPAIVLYLQDPPNVAELDRVLLMLEMEPRDFMRTQEALYKDLDLSNPSLSRQALLEAMVHHPILIERPVVIHGDKATIGRPPEQVLTIL